MLAWLAFELGDGRATIDPDLHALHTLHIFRRVHLRFDLKWRSSKRIGKHNRMAINPSPSDAVMMANGTPAVAVERSAQVDLITRGDIQLRVLREHSGVVDRSDVVEAVGVLVVIHRYSDVRLNVLVAQSGHRIERGGNEAEKEFIHRARRWCAASGHGQMLHGVQ